MKEVVLPNQDILTPANASINKYYGVLHFPSKSRGFVTADAGNRFRQCWGYNITNGNYNHEIKTHESLESLLFTLLRQTGPVTYKVYEFDTFHNLMKWVMEEN